MKLPTRRQLDVLRLIAQSVADRGYPPTHRELAESLDVSSTNAVGDLLDALERKRLITRPPGGQSRALTLTPLGRSMITALPPSAGTAFTAEQVVETLDLSA